MYTKPIIYKVYSVIVFALASLGFLGSVIYAAFGAEILKSLLPDRIGAVIYITTMICAAFISLFFAYVEFTSMFTFAQMIEHEESRSPYPFRRMGMVFPPKFYKVFGSILFYVPLVVDFIAAIAMVISYSVTKKAFLAIPLIPLAIMLLSLLLTYITYYCRYRTFGDLLELKSSNNVSINTVNSLAENKPNVLRGYCIFLYILAIICFIGSVVSLFFVASPIAAVAGTGAAVAACVGIVIYAIVLFMAFGVIGCYYDNLAKMLEHYMIEYKLL